MSHIAIERIKKLRVVTRGANGFRAGYHHAKVDTLTKIHTSVRILETLYHSRFQLALAIIVDFVCFLSCVVLLKPLVPFRFATSLHALYTHWEETYLKFRRKFKLQYIEKLVT